MTDARALFDMTSEGDAVLRLHVQPGAGRTAVVGRHGEALKVRIAAPPTGGRANAAAIALLADVLGLDAGTVSVTGGESSRTKRVRITGVEADELARRLDKALAEAAVAPGRGDGHRDSRF